MLDEKDYDKDLVVIDVARKGNVVRFYLGKKEGKWGWTNPNYKDSHGRTPDWLKPSDIYYGDDWDDAPYEHNAGPVYDEFIKGFIDIGFSYDCTIIEPCDNAYHAPTYSKEDMVNKKIPALIIFPSNIYPERLMDYDRYPNGLFDQFKDCEDTKITERIYFGDSIVKLLQISKREDM